MKVKTKICGLTDIQNIDVAIKAGADFYGLVFFPKSPRNIELEKAARLIEHSSQKIQSVALCVNPTDEQIQKIISIVNPDWIQLHGKETPSRVKEIKKLSDLPIIKAIGVASENDAMTAVDYKCLADIILFDAKPVAMKDALPGGNGLSFDWTYLKAVKQQMNFMLSGGLDADNVQEAIEQTGASAVDVSSGVEKSPGIKDPELIQKFISSINSLNL